jgi:prevent-host-death family protein
LELAGRVHAHHERVTVTVHGRPSAVLIAVEDLEALQETLSVLPDPDTLRRLVDSDAELAPLVSCDRGSDGGLVSHRYKACPVRLANCTENRHRPG